MKRHYRLFLLAPLIIVLVGAFFTITKVGIFAYAGKYIFFDKQAWTLTFDEPKEVKTPEWSIQRGNIKVSDEKNNSITIILSDKDIPNTQAESIPEYTGQYMDEHGEFFKTILNSREVYILL